MGNVAVGPAIELDKVSFDPKRLTIHWNDGHRSIYDAVWLRDNCPADRDSRTGQRLVDITDLPNDPAIGAISQNSGAILVTWRGEPKSNWFPLDWLRDHCYCDEHRQPRKPVPILWRSQDSSALPWAKYDELLPSKRLQARWLRAIVDYGVAFVHGVPARDGHVLDISRMLGYVRETNYGRVFDVRSVVNPNNLAYSDRGLGVHTDNPYRDPVPGLQLLHCIHADEEGGESLFVDGFAVAHELRTQDPQAFATLTKTPVPFAFRDSCTDLRTERRLLELNFEGEIAAVYYNSRSIRPLRLPPKDVESFYRAYRAFATLLRDPRFEFRLRLRTGDLVAFNNRRILHGRTAFSPAAGRWLQGCYVDWDGLMSNLTILERGA